MVDVFGEVRLENLRLNDESPALLPKLESLCLEVRDYRYADELMAVIDANILVHYASKLHSDDVTLSGLDTAGWDDMVREKLGEAVNYGCVIGWSVALLFAECLAS